MTDIEFSEIRYAGKPAAFLRGFRALYLGIPINCIVLGWVNKAMVDILMLVLGVAPVVAPSLGAAVLLKDRVQPRISRLPGVAQVALVGGDEPRKPKRSLPSSSTSTFPPVVA